MKKPSTTKSDTHVTPGTAFNEAMKLRFAKMREEHPEWFQPQQTEDLTKPLKAPLFDEDD